LPMGISPISMEGCAPTGLKYLRRMHSVLVVRANSVIICSPICLVRPYGDSAGFGGVCSVTGMESGLPYTVQEDEKTKYGISNSCVHFSRLMRELRLFSK